eukprot:TRINITY_DN4827_c0_g1_i3.p1 TRINITY_DN4827_c0_g1~~TRINITY_DN4827_c0_g1_i3.p1  ORF type:complete len:1290 (-),score=241.69 TRINITY_DN4827_c0_g1_i3:542-4087(-)
MDPESQVSCYSMMEDDFLVLVPFTKKSRMPTYHKPSEESRTEPKSSDQGTTSAVADSAWLDIMHDLSVLSDISQHGIESNLVPDNRSKDVGELLTSQSSNVCTSRTKRKRGSGLECQGSSSHDFLRDVLKSEDFLSEQNCERLHQALKSVKCLSDLTSGDCMLFGEFCRSSSVVPELKQCMCPSWLKIMLMNFTFLNIFSGFLQMRSEDVSWNRINGAVKQLNGYGVEEVSIADVEQLLILCPKVVMLGNLESRANKMHDTIVIVNYLAESEDQCGSIDIVKKGKQLSFWAIIKSIKKREDTFKAEIWAAIKLFVGKRMSGNGTPVSFSLEDLLVSLKGSSVDSSKCKMKNVMTRSSSRMEQIRCKVTNPLLPVEMVEHLRKGIGSSGQIVHVEEINARMAVHAEFPNNLLEKTKALLERIGISSLYSHQAESIRASLSGKNVVVATSTSSGKSLCYNLPVLEVLSENLLSCALYLFPTKALAQDQLRALLGMTAEMGISLNVGVYDGDTSQADRAWLRDNARLLITNPDMLHMSILPCHRQFQRILSNLRFVVIDEAHAYKGAFGCHTALILRRMRRICSHVCGSHPSFVFCTATSANPREHAMELANLHTLELIQNDGSPCGSKTFVLWNPPLCSNHAFKSPRSMNGSEQADTVAVAKRSSSILEASSLFAEMVQHGLRCIAFCKSRKLSELVLCYTRDFLQETAPHLVDSIYAYRGGYTAQDRRRIEADFFGGKLRGLAATNALELGIDVGCIDATLHLGFPGSVASLWQQAGRSGRRGKPSLAVYIALEGPLDQYFMKFPQKLFGSPIECCQVDAHNQQVIEQHIACAAFEHPLSLLYDERYFGSGLDSAIRTLASKGLLVSDPSCVSQIWSYNGHERFPSNAISIRAIETEKYQVRDKLKDEVLEEIEESKAFFQVYEGAVYMHQGRTYLVKALDLSTKIAYCQEADLKYYTKTRDYTDIHVIGGDLAYPAKVPEIHHLKTTAQAHNCKVTTNWFGFYRIWRGSNQIFDAVDLSLPKYSYESQAVWIRVPQSIKTAVLLQDLCFRAGLHAASHALLNVVPMYIMCNSSDLGSECANPHDTRYIPERILLYDRHPGGIGISAQARPLFRELLSTALEILTTCCCSSDAGCPNCIQSLSCGEYNEVLDKTAAIMILKGVIDAETSHFERSRAETAETL